MANGWQDDKRWSDRFLPEIKRILGEHLIGEPPLEEDQERNTDLIVLRMDPLRIACRVRRPGYLKRFGHEFTIREGRPSGVKTELSKVLEGWGDYLFYGHADDEERRLAQWFLLDLRPFRLWFHRQTVARNGSPPGEEQDNRDGSSWFRAFDVRALPEEVLYRVVWAPNTNGNGRQGDFPW
jgi:hypothetical protein